VHAINLQEKEKSSIVIVIKLYGVLKKQILKICLGFRLRALGFL